MIKSEFQEIEYFFNRPQFTPDELDILLECVEKAYPDIETKKEARNLINLKLVRYELTDIENIEATPSKIHPTQPSKKSASKIPNFSKHHPLELYVGLSIDTIAEKISAKPELLQYMLGRKGAVLSTTVILSLDHLLLLSDYLINKSKQSNRLQKISTKSNSKFKSPSKARKFKQSKKTKYSPRRNGNSVYDKIRTYGLGKLIYIRKKN